MVAIAGTAAAAAKLKKISHRPAPHRQQKILGAIRRLTLREEDIEAALPLLAADSQVRFMAEEHIMVRAEPSIDSARTGDALRKGYIFEAQEIVTLKEGHHVQWDHVPVDEPCFIRIGEYGAWIYSHHAVTGERLFSQVVTDDVRESWLTYARHVLMKVLASKEFDYFINCVVIANTIVVGLDIDHRDMFSTQTWDHINLFFAAVYVIEVIIKLSVLGVRPYFESKWNCADFSITLATLLADMGPILRSLFPGFGGMPRAELVVAVAPILRLFRLVRLGKIFPEFRSLVSSFVLSIEGLFWAILLMLFLFFFAACITTVFLARLDDPSIPEAAKLREMFGSIPRSMFSLFEVMTLIAFQEVVRPLLGKRPGLVFFFCAFIFSSFFVLLNLITGVVTDKMLESKSSDQHMKESLEIDRREMALHDLRLLLRQRSEASPSPLASPMAPSTRLPDRPRLSRAEAGIAEVPEELAPAGDAGSGASEVSSFDAAAVADRAGLEPEDVARPQPAADAPADVVRLEVVGPWLEEPDVGDLLKLAGIEPSLVVAACAVLSKDERGCVSIDEIFRGLRRSFDHLSTVKIMQSQANLAGRCEQRTDRLLDLLTLVRPQVAKG